MKSYICEKVQDLLAETGSPGLDRDAREHLMGCPECQAVERALGEVDRELQELPRVDAPEELVSRLLGRVASEPAPAADTGVAEPQAIAEEPPGARSAARAVYRAWDFLRALVTGRLGPLGSLAAAAVAILVMSLGLFTLTWRGGDVAKMEPSSVSSAAPPRGAEDYGVEGGLPSPGQTAQNRLEVEPEWQRRQEARKAEEERVRGLAAPQRMAREQSYPATAAPPPPAPPPPEPDSARDGSGVVGGIVGGEANAPLRDLDFAANLDVVAASKLETKQSAAASVPQEENELDALARSEAVADDDLGDYRPEQQLASLEARTGLLKEKAQSQTREELLERLKSESFESQVSTLSADKKRADLLQAEKPAPGTDEPSRRAAGGKSDLGGRGNVTPATPPGEPLPDLAEEFLLERESTEGLRFQAARGYWRNTYVPGDPRMRLLGARLAQLAPSGAPPLDLRPYTQPLDPPRNGAISVFVNADRQGIDGKTRTLIQVGIQGAERGASMRPAMNIGVVVDARAPFTPVTAQALRSLLVELGRLKQAGDRFSVTIAGAPGGMVIPCESYKHGPIAVTMEALQKGSAPGEGPALGLLDAMEVALRDVVRADDPNAPLGASALLLVTPGQLGSHTDPLARMATAVSRNGVSVSVVGLGGDVNPSELDRVALSGQGSRRLVTTAEDATRAADQELSAASRAVARAVRLNIRLGRGVKLIDVLGSERLDTQRTREVKAMEKSIDQRLSRSLGIQADRGQDDDGIQMIIPAFYAGDQHVILLDVVAERAGQLAEVTARFKDLVALRNGVARASLDLDTRGRQRGPLEVAVLKSLVGYRLSLDLDEASRLLDRGAGPQALQLLTRTWALLNGLAQRLPGWANDPEIQGDSQTLLAFVDFLRTRGTNPELYPQLAGSLEQAAFQKLTPRYRDR